MRKIDASDGIKQISFDRTGNKAKRIRFYHNGDKHFSGIVVPVSAHRYRSFDSLKTELTTMLSKKVILTTGIYNVYTLEGSIVPQIDKLEDGKEYVCCGKGEAFKKIKYGKEEIVRSRGFLRY